MPLAESLRCVSMYDERHDDRTRCVRVVCVMKCAGQLTHMVGLRGVANPGVGREQRTAQVFSLPRGSGYTLDSADVTEIPTVTWRANR